MFRIFELQSNFCSIYGDICFFEAKVAIDIKALLIADNCLVTKLVLLLKIKRCIGTIFVNVVQINLKHFSQVVLSWNS